MNWKTLSKKLSKGVGLFFLAQLSCQASGMTSVSSTANGFSANESFQLEEAVQEKKSQDKRIYCSIDVSNNFIPELLVQSAEKDKYFNVFKDTSTREKYGIYASFEDHVKELAKHLESAKNPNSKEAKKDNRKDKEKSKGAKEADNQKIKEELIADHQKILRVLEERVFHARCLFDGNVRYPYVIEQDELAKLVQSTAEQLGLNTFEGTAEFFSAPRDNVPVQLEIPERYQQDYLDLEIEIIKSKKDRKKTSLSIYVNEYNEQTKQDELVKLLTTKAVVGGGRHPRNPSLKFDTPAGEKYLKRIVMMPHWHPPKSWAKEKYGQPVTLPGPQNAFGMFMSELVNNDEPPKNPYGYLNGDRGYRIHLTANPRSVEVGGYSHGCVRIHPNMSRVFYFLLGYTPHGEIKLIYQGGEFIPLNDHIKVRIKE